MASLYPSSIDNFTDPAGTTRVDTGVDHAELHRDVNDAINSMQSVMGTTSGTSVLKNINTSSFAVPANSSKVISAHTLSAGTVTTGTVTASAITASTITTTTISGATISTSLLSGTLNNSVIGTPSITGGTATSQVVNGATLGTPTATAGSWSNGLINTPTIDGGTIYPTLAYQEPVTSTGTTAGTITLNLSDGNIQRITMPNNAGSIKLLATSAIDGARYLVSITQGTAGLGTIGWFPTVRWSGGVTPTLVTTASKRDIFGFIATGTATFDGVIIGQNI